MASDLTELTEIERDAISEIANMGVSRAAASLRQMVGEQVLLSVPTVRIVSREEAAGLVERGISQARRRAAVLRGTFLRPGAADLPASAKPRARPLDCRGGALAGRRHRSGTGGVGGNRQYYPECLPGDDRQRASQVDADVASVGDPRRRRNDVRNRKIGRPVATWFCSFTSILRSRTATSRALSPC